MRALIAALIFITLAGCVSAPYRDDYTTHVNTRSEYYAGKDLKFVLAEGSLVDIRGIYSKDNTSSSSPMMYQGGAGLAGLLAQIGTHASLINSQRNKKLAAAQEAANGDIATLISLAEGIDLLALLEQTDSGLISPVEAGAAATDVNIKPIFFASRAMDQISLNTIVWVDAEGSSEGDEPTYQNLIQVFSPKLSTQQSERLANGDKQLLSSLISSLLDTSLKIAKADLTGQYASVNAPDKTYLVEKHFGAKVVRGAVVDHTCGYDVIRDIRLWFVAHSRQAPVTNATTETACARTQHESG
ncbi:hypothetical protein KDX31_01480 [Amphritea atlantica]|uniref:Curli production assembly/transport component CsgG n=1 Tax=Amphritea atlantica TaxID=355243 RepID=A0ABY5GWR5_9GAMM|nr:hypothetical protein KDX31_01480 [Amphritea atlantica]